MPVPSSGELKLRADIANEVDGSATGDNVSLGTLSNTAGFTEPDAMSEFYGYTACTVPSVTTNGMTSVTVNSMRANGNVTSDNGCSITQRGFYFGTSSNYASNGKYSVSGTTGSFNRSFGSLASSTTYYATAYAINSEGESVGSTVSAATSTPITYTGYSTNNNIYNVIEIGNFNMKGGGQNLNGYGQYLHSQLGWQTDNSCINRSFNAGTSGSNPSNFCSSYQNSTVGFHPDMRAGSTYARSRATCSISSTTGTNSCCGDNYAAYYANNLTNMPNYSSSSFSSSGSPYNYYTTGTNSAFMDGCPVSLCNSDPYSASSNSTIFR